MSKVSFRARTLDASKPLPIYKSEDLPDLYNYNVINRAVPQMPTGMEKEEESETHLQQAISVVALTKDKPIIPTPDADVNVEHYDAIYNNNVKMPRTLIKLSAFDALGLDAEYAEYDMDTDDEEFLTNLSKTEDLSHIEFEKMVEVMEKESENQVITLAEAQHLVKDIQSNVIATVYDYWLNKRLSLQIPLLPAIKTGTKDPKHATDPYAAFRKRQEKMLTRKNRKNDESSYTKMFKLKQEITRAVQLLELVKNRERTKKELLKATVEIFKKRCELGDFDNAQSRMYSNNKKIAELRSGIEESRKSKISPPSTALDSSTTAHSSSTSKAEDSDIMSLYDKLNEAEDEVDYTFPFKRKKYVNYHAPREPLNAEPWKSREEGGQGSKKYRYSCNRISSSKCIGMSRRRIGRGGRVWIDRITETDHNKECQYPHKAPPDTTELDYKAEIDQMFDKLLSEMKPINGMTIFGPKYNKLIPDKFKRLRDLNTVVIDHNKKDPPEEKDSNQFDKKPVR